MRTSILLALFVLTLLAACDRTSDPVAVSPSASIAAPANVDAVPAATVAAPSDASKAPAPGEPTTFDAKTFAGTFASDGMVVRFKVDGTYTLSSHAANASSGTWTLEPDGRHIRLDADAEGEADRLYVVLDKDALRAAHGPQILRREAGK